ncbi:MAG: Flp family type IVb pilin, partial [Pontixanthobacter sp.]
MTALPGDQAGSTSIEYGLLASLIAVAMMQAVETVGTAVTGTFDTARAGLAVSSSAATESPTAAGAVEPPVAAAKAAAPVPTPAPLPG